MAREVSCSRGRVFLACAAEARGWIGPGPPLHTCSGPLVGEAQCRARCRCARVRWFCHLGPFPRAPLDPQEIGKFPKGNVSCRTPGINRTPAKVRRRAASRNLLRPPDATPQRDEVKAEGANLVKAEPVLHGEETRIHLPVQTEMSSARQSLGRLNDALSFIPTVMTTSLATAPALGPRHPSGDGPGRIRSRA